MHKWDT